jgi:uncharacterized membrane protein YeaQ/YmgE (transglycosylase-associated protein family)
MHKGYFYCIIRSGDGEARMGYIGLWLLCGVVAAAIYSNEGRPWFTALLVGLISGPIGAILAAVTPADKAGLEQQALVSGSKKCPRCAEPVKAEATVCRFCGHEFVSSEQAAGLKPDDVAKLMRVVRADATFCKHCKRAFTVEHPILPS